MSGNISEARNLRLEPTRVADPGTKQVPSRRLKLVADRDWYTDPIPYPAPVGPSPDF